MGSEMCIRDRSRGVEGVAFAVEDSGCGIEDDSMGRLFEAFSQLETVGANSIGGTGLGLAISQRLSEAMNGELSVESSYGRGSVFTCWVPLAASDAGDVEDYSMELASSHSGAKVLLVEDNKVNQQVIQSILRKADHHCVMAANGLEALRCLSREDFDFVLMDCRMPVLDGFEATKMIRRFPLGHCNREIPVVAITANAFDDDRQKCFESGMDNFLSKPVNSGSLLQAISFYASGRAKSA